MVAVALVPIVGLAEQILRVIANHQELILAADPETRERFMERLDKWESFWEGLVRPLYEAVITEQMKQSKPEPKQ